MVSRNPNLHLYGTHELEYHLYLSKQHAFPFHHTQINYLLTTPEYPAYCIYLMRVDSAPPQTTASIYHPRSTRHLLVDRILFPMERSVALESVAPEFHIDRSRMLPGGLARGAWDITPIYRDEPPRLLGFYPDGLSREDRYLRLAVDELEVRPEREEGTYVILPEDTQWYRYGACGLLAYSTNISARSVPTFLIIQRVDRLPQLPISTDQKGRPQIELTNLLLADANP